MIPKVVAELGRTEMTACADEDLSEGGCMHAQCRKCGSNSTGTWDPGFMKSTG